MSHLPTSTDVPPRSRLKGVTDRYVEGSQAVLLTGVQAVARLLVEQHARDARAGLRTATFVSGYRGSPLGGLDRTLAALPDGLARHGVHLQPGLNEELGATAVWGSQVLVEERLTCDGVIGVWYGKAPGVDRASDAIRHGNLQGAHPMGGVLVLAGDDPAAKSSTLPCASEQTLAALNLPVLYPRSSEELVTFGLLGVAISRATGLWVGMKITSDVADGLWSVSRNFADLEISVPEIEWEGQAWSHRQAWAATLPWSRDAEAELSGPRWAKLLAICDANEINRIEVDPPAARLGLAAPGKTYDDMVHALLSLGLDEAALMAAGIRLLRVGMIYPLSPTIAQRFAEGLETVVVVEEKRGLLEHQLKAALYGLGGPSILGKNDAQGRPLVPGYGALSPDMIAAALRKVLPSHVHVPPASVKRAFTPLAAPRTAYFCSGCPHNKSTVVPEGSLAGGGIGCHAMALRMPQNHGKMTGITQMGGEGAQWIGQTPFTQTGHIFQNMGDGTYFHSGQLAVQACVAAGVNITFKILYNAAVAMTGGQDADGALPVPALTRKLAAEGVTKIIVCAENPNGYGDAARFAADVDIWPRDRLAEAQTRLREISGVTVLIYDEVCAAESRRLRKRGLGPQKLRRAAIAQAICEGCGDCGAKSNCLSVQPVATEFGRKTRIDQASCNLDYSCVEGECPAFITLEPTSSARGETLMPQAPPVAEPKRPTWDGAFEVLLAGIGGTGVVTVNQLLAAAAQADGFHIAGVDQTGLSQKAGPVTSHLRFARELGALSSNKVSRANLFLVFDPLVGAEPELLARTDPAQTVAVISSAHTPTGAEVRFHDAAPADANDLVQTIVRQTARSEVLDSLSLARRLLGSPTAANLMLVGAAYQIGSLPITAASLEAAIVTNGVAVETNLAAFRWGRALMADQTCAPREPHDELATGLAAAAWVGDRPFEGETRRLAGLRAVALVKHQGRPAAHQYLDRLEAVWGAERRLGARTEFSEAAARGLHRMMAYKDEYEVARLLVSSDTMAEIRKEFGAVKRVRFQLQPPLFRKFGLHRKVGVGPAFRPLLHLLAAGRMLRGTPLDPFGRAPIRKLERALLRQYQAMLVQLTEDLSAQTYDRAVEAASACELVRGYEHVKANGARRYLQRLKDLHIPCEDALQIEDLVERAGAQTSSGAKTPENTP